ncbi:MAG TPA: SDR family oxidoreductase [Jatrophihabitantaceae bacterium]
MTGAGRGIGRAVALDLARAGAKIALAARTVDELEHTATLIREEAGTALVLPTDVADAAQLDAAIRRTQEELGTVEILVNNAAVVWPIAASATLEPDDWAAAIGINVTAAARLSFAVLPGMLERGWGRLVNVSSGIASHPAGMLRANAYATSKAALEAHTINLAAELAGTGVTINAYRPGTVDTAMQGWIRAQDPYLIGADLHDRFVGAHEQGALISPEQSSKSLLSRLSGDATGQIWDVNP